MNTPSIALGGMGLEAVRGLPLAIPEEGFDSDLEERIEKARQIFFRTVGRMLTGFQYKGAFTQKDMDYVREQVRSFRLQPLAWSYLEDQRVRDIENCGHAVNYENMVATSIFGMLVARDFGMSESASREIGEGGSLHDIGKRYTPDFILYKGADRKSSGKLTPEEKKIMQLHVTDSVRALDGCGEYRPVIRAAATEHHMCISHNGNPNSKLESYGNKIDPRQPHLSARIIAPGDAVDSMVSGRYYRDSEECKFGNCIEHAISELDRESEISDRNPDGIHFDKRFVSLLKPYLERALHYQRHV
jgi:HD-GYP domain-containing protein (c-di-GMP phosphodiesterase class II)